MYRGNPRLTGVVQGRGPHHLHGVKWHLKAPVFAISSLAAAQHMLYFGGSDGSLFAVDAEQGTVQWQFELSQLLSFCPVSYTPAIERGIVYYPVAGEQGSFLYAIDAQTGQEVSHYPTTSLFNPSSPPFTVHEGVAYLNGAVHVDQFPYLSFLCSAIDLQTGERKWTVDLGVKRYSTTLAIAHEMIYFTSLDALSSHRNPRASGHLHALHAPTGEEVWRYDYVSPTVGQDIAVTDTEVLLFTGTGLEAVDALTGEHKWSHPYALIGPPTVTDNLIFIPFPAPYDHTQPRFVDALGSEPSTGGIAAWDRTTQEQKWSTTLKNGQDYTGGALIAGEMLYTVWKHIDIQGRPGNAALFALDAQTGQEQWRFEARDLDVFPLVEHDHVFIVSNQGIEAEETYIYALH